MIRIACFSHLLQHILYLWTHAEESYLLHHYLRIYFPWAHGKPNSQRLYHASLISEEKARLAETGLSCFRFMHDAKLWEEQRLRELDVSMCVCDFFSDERN